MNEIEMFERRIGGRWTGVSFHRKTPSGTKMADRSMYFCEAVKVSSTHAITLTRGDLNCSGARRSFGWNANGDSAFVDQLISRNGFSPLSAATLIRKTPKIEDEKITAITVGTYEAPDIVISYLQPEHAMRFMLLWQERYHTNLDISLSSVMAVCGSVAAGVYANGNVRCSFGCPESRLHGCIGRDRLVIGVPTKQLKDLL